MDFDYFDAIKQEMDKGKVRPVTGTRYNGKEVLTTLALADSPSFGFKHNRLMGVIQNSHLTRDELLSVPGMDKSIWSYRYTTKEWIPVFHFEGMNITLIVDLLRVTDYDGTPYWWATPKGFPRDHRM